MKIIAITTALLMLPIAFAGVGSAAPSQQPAAPAAERSAGPYLQTPAAGVTQDSARKAKSKPRAAKDKRKGGGGHLGHH